MMLFVVTFATKNAVNVSKTWNISQFIGSIIGEFNFPVTWLELRGITKMAFLGFEAKPSTSSKIWWQLSFQRRLGDWPFGGNERADFQMRNHSTRFFISF